jgi:hypothetical protein
MSYVGTWAKVLFKLELKTDERQTTNCYIYAQLIGVTLQV